MQYLGHETLEILNLRNANKIGNRHVEVLQQDKLFNTLTGKQAEHKQQDRCPYSISGCVNMCLVHQAMLHVTLSKQILTVVG